VNRLLGYCVPPIAAPGEPVEVKVSVLGGGDYSAALLRCVCGDDSPAGPGLDLRPVDVAGNGRYRGREQRIVTGSWIRVEPHSVFASLESLTVQLLVWPTAPAGRVQSLVSCRGPDASGFWLGLDARGCATFEVGGRATAVRVTTGMTLDPRRWWLVYGSYDAETLSLVVGALDLTRDGWVRPPASARAHSTRRLHAGADAPLTIAATLAGGGEDTSEHFDGKLERPVICSTALDVATIRTLAVSTDACPARTDVVACWDFALDIGSVVVRDIGSHRIDGVARQLPHRAVTGWHWDGRAHDWRSARSHYAAIHFHSDDLYDCEWSTDFTLALPPDLPSGYYVVRLSDELDTTYVSLFVRAPRRHATSPVAFLASTATYLAYANYRFHLDRPEPESQLDAPIEVDDATQLLQAHPEIGLSQYDEHADGSGARHSSWLRPIVNLGPCGDIWTINADSHLLAWLDHEGIEVDLITDEDVHTEGMALISRYRCIVTGTHPEYCSTPMRDALEQFVGQGGRLMYLGGNGFYWRIAYHETLPWVTEVRRAEGGARYWTEAPGEYYHAFTGEYGGLWRRVGRPPEQLTGVGTRAIGFGHGSAYRLADAARDPRVNWMFAGLETATEVGARGLLGAACGVEIDAANTLLGTPSHALLLATAARHAPATFRVPEEILMPCNGTAGGDDPAVRGDLVFFETVGGGAVFATGSVAWCACLPIDGFANDVATLTGNVLRRFVDPVPFNFPGPRG